MPTLHVRNVPDKLYKRIQKIADDEGRSLTTEVVQLLDRGIRNREAHRGATAILARARKRTLATRLPAGWKDASTLLRRDRCR